LVRKRRHKRGLPVAPAGNVLHFLSLRNHEDPTNAQCCTPHGYVSLSGDCGDHWSLLRTPACATLPAMKWRA
jgi:hypothetical protein